jgi:ATP-dependent Clp protease ATP-binding subunit ClpA
MTSNIGSAELMSLQHSNDATLERHVLARAQQALRPEIFARINEKLKWTPLFGPKNAEFKLGFQVLSGLVVCCFIALR